ncbi:MAG: hypothetical protein ABSH17_12735, partial [Syntrophobacteraceae bacterium]
MATAMESHNPIPVICVDGSTVAGAEIFDPNSWSGGSKGLVLSCWTEHSVLYHCIAQLSAMCEGAERLCAKNFKTLQRIVAATVDGFHRDQNGYGGRVLNALRNNAMKQRKDAA